MPSGITDALKNTLLNQGVATTNFMALYTVAPTKTGGGTEVVTTNGYARVAIPNGMFPDASTVGTNTTAGGMDYRNLANVAALNFPIVTADSGTVRGWAILNVATGGNASNMLWFGDLTTSKAYTQGDTLTLGIGAVILQLGSQV